MITLSSFIQMRSVSSTTKNIILSIVGAVLMAVFSQIAFTLPFTPVRITGLTFAVLCVGMALGSKFGALSVVTWIGAGVIGIPVFSSFRHGLATLLGPSGGYFFGSIVAAYFIGLLAEKGWDRSFSKAFVAMIIGNVILYIPGLVQLGIVLGWDKPIFTLGLTPFIIGDILKALLAASLWKAMWGIVDKQ